LIADRIITAQNIIRGSIEKSNEEANQ